MREKEQKGQKGSIILSFLLLIFVSVVGISLLTFCILHTRTVKARTFRLVETEKIFQASIFYLHNFREKIFNERVQDFQSPDSDFFNSENFPDTTIKNDYFVSHHFKYIYIPQNNYTKTRITVGLDFSTASPETNNYCISSEVFIDIFQGQIPLTAIPFFMNNEISYPSGTAGTTAFLKNNNIENKSKKNAVAEKIDVELGHAEFLLDALKIGGEVIGWREIREKFGLPPSDLPISNGIHLITEDNNIESIFIQGNIERMVFSTSNQLQKIRFIQNAVPYELSYKPDEKYFKCWDASISLETLFKEKIIVNGTIWSLEQEGNGAFLPQSNLSLLVTGKTVISSSLETIPDQLDFNEKLFSNLTLTCGKEHLEQLASSESIDPGIIVENIEKLKLQISMITEGKFINKSEELKLSGSLYCEDFENHGLMEIYPPPMVTDPGNYYHTIDYKYVNQFLIHFLEEK